MNRKHVIVVGGGAIGTAAAYYLAKADWRVTLLDKDRQGEGGTSGNCGLISPSHVRPLNEPGAVSKTLKAMCRPGSPLYIKPRIDPGLWWWLAQFARRCTSSAMLRSARALHPLLQASASELRKVLDAEEIQCDWQHRGCLFVYETPAGMAGYADVDRMLREHFDEPATRYDGDAVVELEPALQPGSVAGGWHYEDDGHLDPAKLLNEWRRVLESLDVTIHEQCKMEGFVQRANAACAVMTNRGEMPADAFVVATGARTPLLARQLGCRVPVQPGKGYSRTLPRPDECPAIPMIFQERKVAVTPLAAGVRFGSTMEFSGYDPSLNPRRLSLLTETVKPFLKMFDPECAATAPTAAESPDDKPLDDKLLDDKPPDDKPWYGWRPMTVDSVPIIDHLPTMPNVVLATGHNMLGLTLSAITGRLVMEMLSGRVPLVPLEPYALSRF